MFLKSYNKYEALYRKGFKTKHDYEYKQNHFRNTLGHFQKIFLKVINDYLDPLILKALNNSQRYRSTIHYIALKL